MTPSQSGTTLLLRICEVIFARALSTEEVRKILSLIRLPRYRVCLSTIYSYGLRLQEGTHVQVPDVDSARMVLHVRHGKGGKDRYVPLPQTTLEMLRRSWASHRNRVWVFAALNFFRVTSSAFPALFQLRLAWRLVDRLTGSTPTRAK